MTAAGRTLSDEEIERIAQRVAELVGEKRPRPKPPKPAPDPERVQRARDSVERRLKRAGLRLPR